MKMSEKCEQIFILSGQSNMSGRGGIVTVPHHHNHWDGVVPPECQPHRSILRLTAHLHWEIARDPLHADIDSKKVCGVGPGMPFANAMREHVGGTLGLVPCAIGGTKIKKWARGEKLYESMVERAKAAVADGGEIKALLWYQGESDTWTAEDAAAYGGKMEKLICDVRDHLQLPCLPIIQVALASGNKKHIQKVRAAQLGMKLPNVVCVDAKGLKLNHDNLHLTTESQVQLGQMLANAYLSHFHHPPLTEPQKKLHYSESKGDPKHRPLLLFFVFCFGLALFGSVLLSVSFWISCHLTR